MPNVTSLSCPSMAQEQQSNAKRYVSRLPGKVHEEERFHAISNASQPLNNEGEGLLAATQEEVSQLLSKERERIHAILIFSRKLS